MNFLKLGEKLSSENDAETRQAEILDEAQNYKLASNGGYLTVVKYALFGMLAVLNFRLFVSAIPGIWGWLVGCMAVLMEGFAVYCWNNQGKSEGKHRTALIVFCVAFTAVSLAHAAASVYELVNGTVPLGPSISKYVFWYSHVVAFPLIFGLMIVALFVIGFTHYLAKISKERAKAQVEIEKGNAELATKTAKLKQEAELAEQQILFEKRKLQVKMQMSGVLADTLAEETRQMQLLRSTPDPTIRQRLAELLGLPDLRSAETPAQAAEEKRYLTPPTTKTSAQSSNFFFPSKPEEK